MSKERTEEIIVSELNKARQEQRVDKIPALREELQALLTKGAKTCPKCKNKPMGIHQPTYYEIGCLVCGNNTHSQGFTLKNAIDNWNEDIYFIKKKK